MCVVKNNSLEYVKYLCEEWNVDINEGDEYKHTALDLACSQGYYEIVKYFI